MTTHIRPPTGSKPMRMMLIAAQISAAIAASVVGRSATPVLAAPSQITGVVFNDYNDNGVLETTSSIPNNGSGTIAVAVDTGVGGVVVTAYDSTGANVGSTTSVAGTGAYTLNITSPAGPYRLEFTNLPAGFQPAAHGSSNGTSVQFVPDGNSSNINFGIFNPQNYCQNNPQLVTSCYVFGNQVSDDNSGSPVIVDFPYSAGSNGGTIPPYDQPTGHLITVLANQVGTTWGLAYARNAKRLYAAAFFKKHAGFGPSGPGAIYVINPATNAVVITFSVPGATTNLHSTDYFTDNFNIGWNAVYLTSLGGVALSPDESTLYAMNLENRTLYALNTSNGAVAASQPVPLNPPNCPAQIDVRPFAVEVYQGVGYVGMVCSAQSTQNTADLRAYVYSFNLSTLAFSASPVFQFQLNYPRGIANNDPNVPGSTLSAVWNPWSPTFTAKPPNFSDPNGAFPVYPQPALTSIAFDANGDMIMGIRDRFGDQMGNQAPADPNNPGNLYYGVVAGDTLRACGNPSSGWTLESNSRCGGQGSQPQNNGQGPGNGEYYHGEEYVPYHEEVSLGGIVQVPGFPDVVSTVFNPIPIDGSVETTFDGGARWFNNPSGGYTKAYRVYNGSLANGNLFGKAGGLGDLVALCDAAPIELGNRVWLDSNNNGRQDPNESPLANVVVGLYDVNGTLLITTTTAADGTYYFTSTNNAFNLPILPNTQYSVRVDTTQAALTGLNLTTPNYNGNTTNNAITDVNDSDALSSGNFGVIAYTTGGPGGNNHGLDFGFAPQQQRISLGNQVWYDTNNNGFIDSGEVGVPGVKVDLYQDTNGDCVYSPGVDNSLGTTTTGAGGFYTFTNLLPNAAYIVVLPAVNFDTGGILNKYQNSSTAIGCNIPQQDNQNHGFVSGTLGSGGYVASRAITLTVTDLSFDFGFYQLSLGNQVWEDRNNNGQIDSGEPGIQGVTVQLTHCDGGALSTTTTDASGIYNFTGLISATYCAEIVVPSGYVPSKQIASSANPNNNVDSDQNGVNLSGSTLGSNSIQMTPGYAGALNNNTVNNTIGSTYNPTLDFGVWRPAGLGDFVWLDLNKNGLQDAGEPGVSSVSVKLLDATNNVISTTTTNINGNYIFTGLIPSTYSVCFTVPQAYSFTIPNAGNPGQDSDANQTTGCTQQVTLAPGEYNPTIDAGLITTTAPALQIIKLSNPKSGSTVNFGDPITYTLVVSNVGGSSATNVVVTDSVPAGSDYVNGSSTPPPVSGPNPLVWNLGTIDTGQAKTIVFVVRVQSNPGNVNAITNTAKAGCVQCGELTSNEVVNVFRTDVVTLVSFNATLNPDGGVKVAWQTSLEDKTAGFNVLRSTTGKLDDAVKVNAELIPSQGSNSSGASYSIVDSAGTVNATYWLQEIELDNKINYYGPVTVFGTRFWLPVVQK